MKTLLPLEVFQQTIEIYFQVLYKAFVQKPSTVFWIHLLSFFFFCSNSGNRPEHFIHQETWSIYLLFQDHIFIEHIALIIIPSFISKSFLNWSGFLEIILPLNENFLNIVVKNILGRLEKNPELSRIPEIAGSFFAEFLEEGTKEHKNPEFFTKFQKNLDWNISFKQFRDIASIITDECRKAKLFSTFELDRLNKSIQKLESFCFKRNLSNGSL